jgi:hypothetical protein
VKLFGVIPTPRVFASGGRDLHASPPNGRIQPSAITSGRTCTTFGNLHI